MHELAIAERITSLVTQRANERHATRVESVRLRIGEASGIAVDSLTFCFELLANESPLLAGAQLTCETPPHRAHCSSCAAEFTVRDYIAVCPQCGEWSNQIVSGTELQVLEMEIETQLSQVSEAPEPPEVTELPEVSEVAERSQTAPAAQGEAV